MERLRSIRKEELLELIKRYNIGKKPLSKLLGWGETTVLLYSAMDEIPDNEYTERLYQLYVDKGQYLEVLMNNKSNITDIAYRKSLRAIHQPILDNRILMVAQFVMDINRKEISQARLEVILLWSQIASLVLMDKPLFDDIYQPTKGNGNSPYKMVAEKYREKQFFALGDCHEADELRKNIYEAFKAKLDPVLTEEIKALISHISEMFSWYGEKAFSELLAFERFILCGPPDSKERRRSASNETLKKLSAEVFTQAKIKKLSDIDSYIAKLINKLRIKKAD